MNHYDFEKYKAKKELIFKKQTQAFKKERQEKGLSTSEEELAALGIRFFENEILDVDKIVNGSLSRAERVRRTITNNQPLAIFPIVIDDIATITPGVDYTRQPSLTESDRIEILKWRKYAETRIKELTSTTSEIPPQIQKVNQPFEYLLKDSAKQILPQLIAKYSKPQTIAVMVFSLQELGLLSKNHSDTLLCDALSFTYGHKVKRQSFNKNVKLYREETPKIMEQVRQCKQYTKSLLGK